ARAGARPAVPPGASRDRAAGAVGRGEALRACRPAARGNAAGRAAHHGRRLHRAQRRPLDRQSHELRRPRPRQRPPRRQSGARAAALEVDAGSQRMPLRTLTLSLSRFAVEGTLEERPGSLAPSTAKRERVGVRVSRRHFTVVGLLAGLIALGALSGCGKKGPLEPPDNKPDKYPKQYPDPSSL